MEKSLARRVAHFKTMALFYYLKILEICARKKAKLPCHLLTFLLKTFLLMFFYIKQLDYELQISIAR